MSQHSLPDAILAWGNQGAQLQLALALILTYNTHATVCALSANAGPLKDPLTR